MVCHNYIWYSPTVYIFIVFMESLALREKSRRARWTTRKSKTRPHQSKAECFQDDNPYFFRIMTAHNQQVFVFAKIAYFFCNPNQVQKYIWKFGIKSFLFV